MYNELIKPDPDVPKNSKSKSTYKRNNILSILRNLESAFPVFYFHHGNVLQPESEENIAETMKLRRQRSDEIVKKEKMINSKLFEKYFCYSRLSDMYKALNETAGSEESKAQVNPIESRLSNLM